MNVLIGFKPAAKVLLHYVPMLVHERAVFQADANVSFARGLVPSHNASSGIHVAMIARSHVSRKSG